MRQVLIALGVMILTSGCSNRSDLLPTTDKWVYFHCPGSKLEEHVCLVKMPKSPTSETRRRKLLGKEFEITLHSYDCAGDGIYGMGAIDGSVFDGLAPLDVEDLQGLGKLFADAMDIKLTEEKTFLYEQKYPAIDFSGEVPKKLGGGVLRARVILYQQYLIFLMANGKTKVVRDPEVSYFFNSVTFYK